MAENELAIGDYLAVLNNLDDYDTAPENEWPSLMTPNVPTQTSDSAPNSPGSELQSSLLNIEPQAAVQESYRNMTFKLCKAEAPKPNDTAAQQTKKVVVSQQIDLSVQATIKFVSDVPTAPSYTAPSDSSSCLTPYQSFQDSLFQTSSNYFSEYDNSSLLETKQFSTPDSGFGTPADPAFTNSQPSTTRAINSSLSIPKEITPKPVKRRRRAAFLDRRDTPCPSNSTELLSPSKMFPMNMQSSNPSSNNCNVVCVPRNDSGIGNSFISGSNDLTDKENELRGRFEISPLCTGGTATTSRRRRRPRIVRPSEADFQEKIAAKLVGRLVIKQSIPKYRITYNELLRRVGPPELFNVSALITLFRIKKDAESSTRILAILKDAGYELKKGRRMNRSITRFSPFAEEEAIETGRDLEKQLRTYAPFFQSTKLYFKRMKALHTVSVFMRRMSFLPFFYVIGRSVIDNDRTPLAFTRQFEGPPMMCSALQDRIGQVTWITHGFSKTALSGLFGSLQHSSKINLNYASFHTGYSGNNQYFVPNVSGNNMIENAYPVTQAPPPAAPYYWQPIPDENQQNMVCDNMAAYNKPDYNNPPLYRVNCEYGAVGNVPTEEGYNAVNTNFRPYYDDQQQNYPEMPNYAADKQQLSCVYLQ